MIIFILAVSFLNTNSRSQNNFYLIDYKDIIRNAQKICGQGSPDTYTMCQYLSMLPDWSLIDESKLKTSPTNYKHRTWTRIDQHYSPPPPYYIVYYTWNPNNCPYCQNCENAYMIYALYNKTLHMWEYAYWFDCSSESPFFYPHWNSFPKMICDYSIADLPLKGKEVNLAKTVMYSTFILGALFFVMGLIISKKQ